MDIKDNLYTKILIWAFNKGQDGFTRQQLTEEFNLSSATESWVEYIFFSGTHSDRPMISRLKEIGGITLFSLTDKGISAAVDFMELHEARESSKQAKKVATWSLWIAIGVGLGQIITSLFF